MKKHLEESESETRFTSQCYLPLGLCRADNIPSTLIGKPLFFVYQTLSTFDNHDAHHHSCHHNTTRQHVSHETPSIGRVFFSFKFFENNHDDMVTTIDSETVFTRGVLFIVYLFASTFNKPSSFPGGSLLLILLLD